MSRKRTPDTTTSPSALPSTLSHEEMAMYSGVGASLLRGDSLETAVGKGIAARGYAGANTCKLRLSRLFDFVRAISMKSDVRRPAVCGCCGSVSVSRSSRDYETHRRSVSPF